jgi:hypothetical protein
VNALAIVLALSLGPAAGFKAGTLTPTSDVSRARVTSTGSTTARALRDVAATVHGVVSPRTYGAVLDGVTDDTSAVQAMLAALGVTPRTIALDGPCAVSANITIPAIQPVRMEGNGAFVGAGIVTYRPWGAVGASAPTVRRLAGTLAVDLSFGTSPKVVASNATGAAVTLDDRGAQKMTWTSANAGQYVGLYAAGPWDFSTSDRFALDVGFDGADTNCFFSVWFLFDAAGYTNYAKKDIAPLSGDKPGRYTVSNPKSDFAVTGTANWAAVQRIEIRLYRQVVAGVNTAYVYGLWSHVAARPKLLLTFDDATASLYAIGFPIMRAAGMRGTVYANGNSTVYGGGFYMTLAQLTEMHAAGWDVGSHTYSHAYMAKMITSYTRVGTTATMVFAEDHGYSAGNEITIAGCDSAEYNGARTVATVPDAKTITFATAGVEADTTARGFPYIAGGVALGKIRSEMRLNRDWLTTHGFIRAREHIAWPYGAWSAEAVGVWRDEFGGKTARTMGATNITRMEVPGTFNGIGAPFFLPGGGLGPSTTAASMLFEVDRAITNQTPTFMLGHGMASSNPASTQMLTSEFQALITGIAARRDAGLIDVVTISEWFDRL